jgi:DNA-binding XRE family transcriptional regulator
MDKKKVAVLLKNYKKNWGLTNEKMAAIIGCSLPTYRLWEKELTKNISKDYQEKIRALVHEDLG